MPTIRKIIITSFARRKNIFIDDYSFFNNIIITNHYSKYWTEKRSNVSCLSPYITHGIISELEVIDKSLKKYSFAKNEKFIQEVLWRTYWKGWLELRPKVWTDYLIELKQIKEDFKNNQNYKNAIEGKTNVECFNYWMVKKSD